MIALWGVCFVVEYVFSIANFFNDLNTDPMPTDISNYSKTFALLDKIPPFIVQSIFLVVIIYK